jgi:hypothetical protein
MVANSRNHFPAKPFGRYANVEPVMPELSEAELEARRRCLALEGAFLMLIDGLAMRGTISADEAEDLLSILAKSFSAARATTSMRMVNQLKQLRNGDGAATPGA